MANFNEKINSHKELFLLDSEDYVIKRVATMDMLESEFDYNMRYLKIDYRLFIQYKDTCRAQEMAGRCCMWSCTSNTRCGFGNPKFDYIAGAVLITDKYVLTYGDTWFEAVDLEEKHVVCKAYVCGRFVSEFRIPAETFDRLFGLKENFPEQYDEIFGQAKVPYAEPFDAQVEADEQDETEAAQIVAETAPESMNDDETTECTTCIKLSKENGDDTYHRNLFGCEFFDTRECQRDIDRVKIGVESVISLMHDALRKLDEAIDDVGRHTELTDNAQLLLRKSELLIDDAMASARAAINDTADVFWKACKYRIKGA